jgi:hypothetical protein
MLNRTANLLVLALVFAATSAAAQPVTQTQFPGTAHIGPATRNVVLRFSCALDRGKINSLATAMDVPDTPTIKNVFNFEVFDGPAGQSAKAHMVATADAATSAMDFGYTGAFAINGAPLSTFTFDIAMTPSEKVNLQRLQSVVEVLGRGQSHLSITIANPRRGGPAIEVGADLNDAQATQLRTALAPCRAPR